MTIIGGRLGDLRVRAEAAVEAFEAGSRSLHRPDGSRLYSDGEHADRESALKRERDAVLAEVEEETRSAIEAAAARISNLENRDPLELLSDGELDRANRLRAFALDEALTLGVEDLVGRLESVLAGGDRGAIFAHWMGARRRREAIIERERTRSAEDPRPANPEYRSGTELDGVLDRMRAALDAGRTAADIEEVRGHVEAAQDVHQYAYFARRDQKSVYEPAYSVPGPGN